MRFYVGDGYKFFNIKCGKKFGGYICEIEIVWLFKIRNKVGKL